MISYEMAADEIYSYICQSLSDEKMYLTKESFREQSYMRWALFEILEKLCDENYMMPENISGRLKPTVFEIMDGYIYTMDKLLSIKDNLAFNIGKHTIIQFKLYLQKKYLKEVKKDAPKH